MKSRDMQIAEAVRDAVIAEARFPKPSAQDIDLSAIIASIPAPEHPEVEPLTDEEIKVIYQKYGVGGLVDYHFARAVIDADRAKRGAK